MELKLKTKDLMRQETSYNQEMRSLIQTQKFLRKKCKYIQDESQDESQDEARPEDPELSYQKV
jgi:hypothetical protein